MHFSQCGNLLNDQHALFSQSFVGFDLLANLCHACDLAELAVYLLADDW